MVPVSDETIFAIDGVTLPPGSARTLRQTLEVLDNGELRRTVNGALVDLTRAQARKFRSTISCDDQDIPGFAHLWKGALVTVDCAAPLSQSITPPTAEITLIRPPVPGSVEGFAADGTAVALSALDGQDASFTAPVALTRFRPRLAMRVVSRSWDLSEAAAETGWSLELEEV
jgi:hypothetical protein